LHRRDQQKPNLLSAATSTKAKQGKVAKEAHYESPEKESEYASEWRLSDSSFTDDEDTITSSNSDSDGPQTESKRSNKDDIDISVCEMPSSEGSDDYCQNIKASHPKDSPSQNAEQNRNDNTYCPRTFSESDIDIALEALFNSPSQQGVFDSNPHIQDCVNPNFPTYPALETNSIALGCTCGLSNTQFPIQTGEFTWGMSSANPVQENMVGAHLFPAMGTEPSLFPSSTTFPAFSGLPTPVSASEASSTALNMFQDTSIHNVVVSSHQSVQSFEPQRQCSNCSSTVTPSWRRSPDGRSLLCNACGL
jgi:hypothetical protein